MSRIPLLLLVGAMVACRGTTDPSRLAGCRGTPAPAPIQGTHPTNAALTRASGFMGRPFGIRVSSAGVVYVTQQDANSVAHIRLNDFATRPAIAVGADPGDVVFSRDGATAFVSNFNDGTVQMLDVATGARTQRLVVAPTNAYRLALSPDDSRLYVTSTNGRLYSVDLTGADATTSVVLGGSLQGIALARDGLTLFASNANGGVWRLNACTLAVTASANLNASPTQDVALGPDESELYVANESGYLDVLNPSTLQSIRRVLLPELSPFGLGVTPDGAQIYVTSPVTGQIAIVDRRPDGPYQVVPVGGTPRRIAFDASGSTAVISNESNWVDVFR